MASAGPSVAPASPYYCLLLTPTLAEKVRGVGPTTMISYAMAFKSPYKDF
jgi:hypothetical protein